MLNATLTLQVQWHESRETTVIEFSFVLLLSITTFSISLHKLQIETVGFVMKQKPRMFCWNKYSKQFKLWKGQCLHAVCVCVWVIMIIKSCGKVIIFYWIQTHSKTRMRCNMKRSSFITFSIWVGMPMFSHDGSLNVLCYFLQSVYIRL